VVVIKASPVTNDSAGMLQGLKAVAVQVLPNHGFDGGVEPLLQLGLNFGWLVIQRAPAHIKPSAKLEQTDLDALRQ